VGTFAGQHLLEKRNTQAEFPSLSVSNNMKHAWSFSIPGMFKVHKPTNALFIKLDKVKQNLY